MRWLRRLLGTRRGSAPTPTEPSHEDWLRGLLEELRTPEAERDFAARDFDALLAEPGRMRQLLEPFTKQGER
jgi:hypothetical protein